MDWRCHPCVTGRRVSVAEMAHAVSKGVSRVNAAATPRIDGKNPIPLRLKARGALLAAALIALFFRAPYWWAGMALVAALLHMPWAGRAKQTITRVRVAPGKPARFTVLQATQQNPRTPLGLCRKSYSRRIRSRSQSLPSDRYRSLPTRPAKVPLTTFVGRTAQINKVRELLTHKRLLTLSGTGGVGKTRLALQVAAQIAGEFSSGQCYVDLARITDPALVPIVVARALCSPDQPGGSAIDDLYRIIGDRHMLVVLDNCEHLVDACAELVFALLGGCTAVTILATSRQPIGVPGELTWLVPSLSLADEAIELFTDRAGLVQPGFHITDDNIELISEICRRLDGLPLAIELAAARASSLSLAEIADRLDDPLRLLTGGPRTVAQRQQALRASIDWSHALLTEQQGTVFRRLAIFPCTFDLDAARAIAGGGDLQPHQVVDQLTQLIDKSLVMVEHGSDYTRYRLLETVRQYATEKLRESGEAGAVHMRHRDHYTKLAALLQAPGNNGDAQLVEQTESEIDNLRAAFVWNRESGHVAEALQLASLLQPIWFGRGRAREGLAWFDSILEDENDNHAAPAPVVARALADKVILGALRAGGPVDAAEITAKAQQALVIARNASDPAVLVRALTACGYSSGYNAAAARRYFAEATELTGALDDKWTLSQILYWELVASCETGHPDGLRAAAKAAQDLADGIGDRFVSRQCRLRLSVARLWTGDLTAAIARARELTAEAEMVSDAVTRIEGLYIQARVLAHQDASAAQAAADTAVGAAREFGGVYQGIGYAAMTSAALAAGDVAAIRAPQAGRWDLSARADAREDTLATHHELMAQSALVQGDVITARRLADEAVVATTGWHLMAALITRARVAIAQGEPEQAHDDIQAALERGAEVQAYLGMPDGLELLAHLLGQTGSHREAGSLFGAAFAMRRQTGQVRFTMWDADYEASVAALSQAMGSEGFDSAWTEGAALSPEEAIAYAQRGRGKRKRPVSGWESLTPAERNVVRLVGEGLNTNEIATRLFVSVRTVQTHLTHIYGKLGFSSRSQLAQEVARHT